MSFEFTNGYLLKNVLRTGGTGSTTTFGDRQLMKQDASGKMFKKNVDSFTLSSSGSNIYTDKTGIGHVLWFSNGHTSILSYEPWYLGSSFWNAGWWDSGFDTTAGAGFIGDVSTQWSGQSPATAAWDIYTYDPHSPHSEVEWYLNRREKNQWQITVQFFESGLRAGATYTKAAGQDPRGTYSYLETNFVDSGLDFRFTSGSDLLGACAPGTLTIS